MTHTSHETISGLSLSEWVTRKETNALHEIKILLWCMTSV
jgi:hypothetical protein